jgi:hypothetical protein
MVVYASQFSLLSSGVPNPEHEPNIEREHEPGIENREGRTGPCWPLPNIHVPEANSGGNSWLGDLASTSAKQNTYVRVASGIRFDLIGLVTNA